MTILTVDGVSKSFSEKEALRRVSFSVEEGEVFSLIGPSGSGKTTLLRLIDLIIHPDDGHIFFDNVDTEGGDKHRRVLRRRMGMVFQYPALFDLTVFDNVAMGLRIRGYPAGEVLEKVQEVLSLVGLSGLARRRANTLSGGEAQRVSLARALVTEPKMLLLDEPTANLDPRNVSIMERIVEQINRESKVTVILATHNLLQAKRLANRVGFLWEGELVEAGECEQMFRNPKDGRTAAYIEGKTVY
ncbi:MAG: phosphate ABC transporter ATP-binding protein [Thaumarchaeota archaeon]|nr:phosphate ABC transporter ATP-binding protein [Nitrososphaerota archaeon]